MVTATYDLLVFDLDGTLADTSRDLARSINHALGAVGRGPLELDTVLLLVGNGVRRLAERALGTEGDAPPDASIVERVLEEFLEHYREHCVVDTRLYPGVEEALHGLRDRSLAVLTNKPLFLSRRILEGLRIDRCFWLVEGGDSAPARKPDPAGLLRLIEKRAVPRERVLFLGDTAIDVATARAAGVAVAGVTYGFRPQDFREHPPDFLLDSLSELVR